ncbi:SixA phosphatase family protein [Epilithonimonas pallida]|uniref:Phosphohistidine phosphatase n=1 Tax=Epilithonimonas pallida TaxID=373671 RepID=A0ABY1QZF1_9FLAO|nr:histidine phosphatase family protein [Epilithonimonas pallida]SMP86604.1 phosphohistidine phosphatase [Epilithonimonas pallida]
MKTLLLVRHSKSDWPEDMDDFDRPLTELGRTNAPKMAEFLRFNNIDIDSFVTSPAVRAKQTCELFSQVYGKDYSTKEKLYRPSEENFLSVIFDTDDSVNSLALFSHNNGISNFANSLSDEIVNLPTSGVVAYEIDCDKWSDFEMAKKKFLYFYSPKNFNQ